MFRPFHWAREGGGQTLTMTRSQPTGLVSRLSRQRETCQPVRKLRFSSTSADTQEHQRAGNAVLSNRLLLYKYAQLTPLLPAETLSLHPSGATQTTGEMREMCSELTCARLRVRGRGPGFYLQLRRHCGCRVFLKVWLPESVPACHRTRWRLTADG